MYNVGFWFLRYVVRLDMGFYLKCLSPYQVLSARHIYLGFSFRNIYVNTLTRLQYVVALELIGLMRVYRIRGGSMVKKVGVVKSKIVSYFIKVYKARGLGYFFCELFFELVPYLVRFFDKRWITRAGNGVFITVRNPFIFFVLDESYYFFKDLQSFFIFISFFNNVSQFETFFFLRLLGFDFK